MCFVKEEYQTWQFLVSHLGQTHIEVGQEPQQEGRIELGIEHQFVGCQDVHHALAVCTVLQKVHDIEGWFTEELVGTLVLQGKQGALYGTHAGC